MTVLRNQYWLFAAACLVLFGWQVLALAIGSYLDSTSLGPVSTPVDLLSGAHLWLLRGMPLAIAVFASLPLILLLLAGLNRGDENAGTFRRDTYDLRNWLLLHGCVLAVGVALLASPTRSTSVTRLMLPGLFALFFSLGASLAFAVRVERHLRVLGQSVLGPSRLAILSAALYAFLAEVAVLVPLWAFVRARRHV